MLWGGPSLGTFLIPRSPAVSKNGSRTAPPRAFKHVCVRGLCRSIQFSALLTSDFLGCIPRVDCGSGFARLIPDVRKKLR